MNPRNQWWVGRKRKFWFIGCMLALTGIVAFLWLCGGQNGPVARLEVISQTPTNNGQIVHFRLISRNRGQIFVGTAFRLAYNKPSSLQASFRCISDLQGLQSGLKDFDIFFPDNSPIWRLQVEVQPQAPILERLKWDMSFTIESLKGCGWLPTLPEFFNLLESYKNFNPGPPKIIISKEIAFPNQAQRDNRTNGLFPIPTSIRGYKAAKGQ